MLQMQVTSLIDMFMITVQEGVYVLGLSMIPLWVKAVGQYFHVVLFMLYKVVLTFKSCG